MSLLKQPIINIIFIGFMSVIYSFIFIFTAGHMEFVSILSHRETLNSSFWNGWSDFLRTGNMRFIGYLIIGLTIAIIVFILIKKRKKYDEYQVSILSKSLLVAGTLSILMIPFMMILLLSDSNYAVETIFLFASVQWISVLVSYLIYVIKF
ncbi:hypothetical protein GI584_10710 [Gracilibacillus salitolerans]|uniref:Uncharacterized protein n=1 Tax=Gracilibacillus salitolerans TaxID=2663022 RepID=A0A5Q2TKQ4_9BACI|nr:hypothetical protein [Gracilibacillus salitolerans]QGH34470.1 hypothetical protein GI584_10710 [Gracilibacillus salitolerans]